MRKILFLSQNPTSISTNSPNLVSKLKQIHPDNKWEFAYYNDLEIKITNNLTQIKNHKSNTNLKSYDLVIFAKWRRDPEIATLCATYLHHHKIRFIDQETLNFRARTKILDYVKLNLAKIPVPDTIWASSKHYLSISSTLTYPLILKDNYGTKGQNNYLIKSADELSQKINDNPEIDFIIQKFIPNDFDYRFLVLGDKVDIIIKRTRQDKSTHLNNTSQNAIAELIDPHTISPELIQNAIQSAKAVSRQICGVDIIVNSYTNQHSILEANPWPQIVSGSFSKIKLASLANYIQSISK